MSSMLSTPATIPATKAATLTVAFDPADPGTLRCSPITSCSPARSASANARARPAVDTRLESSNTAETL